MTTKGIAIITGASRGIGYCIARGLALDGYQTILIARDEKRLHAVSEEIAKLVAAELKPEYIVVDITDHRRLHQAVDQIKSKQSPITILVNSAGMWQSGTLDQSAEDLSRLLAINLVAPFELMKAVAEPMKSNGRGYIFNIASRSGKHGFPGSGLYSASKFGLVGLTESLYRELAECGIKVTSISPSWVNTEMAHQANTPLEENEMIQPDDILNSIRYLLGLSHSTSIRELVIECSKRVL